MGAFAGAARTTQCRQPSASFRAAETLQQPLLAQARVAARAQCGLPRAALGRRNRPAPDRGAGESALRARCHARLHEAGLLEGFAGPGRS